MERAAGPLSIAIAISPVNPLVTLLLVTGKEV